jgi:SAM-dependent methyltransferase
MGGRKKPMFEEMYTSGAYLEKWPTWHVEISPWSAKHISRMMARNALHPKTIYEVGCGAGEVLKQLQQQMPDTCQFRGYEISPQAFEMAQSRENDRLHFQLADIRRENIAPCDLLLVIDVLEHVEDCFAFLREIKTKGHYKILHIPLDLTVRSILQRTLMNVRMEHGHIHYYTRELALQTLKDAGYEVLDSFYTSPCTDLPVPNSQNERRRKIMRWPRKLFFALHEDLAARTLGGWSLMVLAK